MKISLMLITFESFLNWTISLSENLSTYFSPFPSHQKKN